MLIFIFILKNVIKFKNKKNKKNNNTKSNIIIIYH